MSEVTIANALETAMEAIAAFGTGDVVQNDYTIFDQWSGLSPYIIISTSDQFTSRQDTASDQTRWEIGLMLALEWNGWKTTLDSFRTHRQSIIDKLNSGNVRSAGGLEGVDIVEIRSLTPITPRYLPYVEDLQEADPLFLFQEMAVVAEEF